ncbi:unnamed protein product [Lymnaea stagnalis]|uniref:Protein kinase domain-containing protein n=1 Tax=Lymnaea stagnalis TaxID=6523 RepID=A0AAV2HN63_LYMST
MEIQLPCPNIWNLFQVISKMEAGEMQSLLYKIAVMIQRMHKSNFIFGELRASQIYVDSTCVGKMRVFPVSLAYLNCVPEKKRQIQFTVPNDPVSRARSAPEINQQGIYSVASDVYSFAVLALELYETKCHAEQQTVLNADIVREGKINPDNVKKPKKMPKRSFDVLKKCLAPAASSRPSVAEIVCVLSSDKTCPTDFLSSDSSSDVYPNDNDTTGSSETSCPRKRKVKRTSPQWSPFVSQKLTRSLSSGVINPSQSESSENDHENLRQHDTRKALSTELQPARNHAGWRYQVKSNRNSSDSLHTQAARRSVNVRLDTSCTQAKDGAWGHSYFQDSLMNPSSNDEYDDVAPKTPPVTLRSKKPLHRTPSIVVQSQAAAGRGERRFNRDSYLHITNSDTEGEEANSHGNTLHETRLMQFEHVYDLISDSDRVDEQTVYLEPFKLR